MNDEIKTPPDDARILESVRFSDPTVHSMLQAGASLGQIIVQLVAEKEQFVGRILALESIAPRKIKMPDGSVKVWRCPDILIPEVQPVEMVPMLGYESVNHE